jgi:hypothetical protein
MLLMGKNHEFNLFEKYPSQCPVQWHIRKFFQIKGNNFAFGILRAYLIPGAAN